MVNSKVINVKLPESEWKKFRIATIHTNETMQGAVRRMILDFLDNQGEQEESETNLDGLTRHCPDDNADPGIPKPD